MLGKVNSSRTLTRLNCVDLKGFVQRVSKQADQRRNLALEKLISLQCQSIRNLLLKKVGADVRIR